MIEKFLNTVHKHKMFEQGEGIVIGVSGGPDSISLLHLLWRIQKEFRLKLYAVHLNHQFRGKEAEADANYVRQFCYQLNVPAYIYSENITAYAKEKGMTDEEAGRERRYQLFYEIKEKTGATKIAVAQNLDDQAETVLLRLMRGAGIEGLSAIEYVRDNTIIRPLLDISRKEIENYCLEYRLEPRIDKTNLEAVYTRNRIRLELLPYMEKFFNPNIKEVLCRTANLLREDRDFINDVTSVQYHKAVHRNGNGEIRIDCREFKKNHSAIKKRILREAVKEVRGNLKNIESKHIETLLDLVENGRTGAEMDLPNQIQATLDYMGLLIRDKKKIIKNKDFEYNVNIGESIHIEALNSYLSSKILHIKDIKEIAREKNRKYFDFDKIQNNIVLRNRRPGDRFTPFGMTGSKKLKDYFIDEKIPKDQRDEIPLVCDGNQVMWIVGYRMSDKYKVDEGTTRILELTYYPIRTE